jgi:putative chromate ion transporter
MKTEVKRSLNISGKFYQNLIKRRWYVILSASLLLLALFILDIASGPAGLSIKEIFSTIFFPAHADKQIHVIVWLMRLPIALMAVIVGASLGVAGAEMQTILDNPLASPYTLGISSAAAFGAALGIVRKGILPLNQVFVIPANAFLFAMLSSLLIFSIAKARHGASYTLVIAGVAFSFLFTSMLSFLQFIAKEDQFQAIVFWMFDSLESATWTKVGIVGLILLISFFCFSEILILFGAGFVAMGLAGIRLGMFRSPMSLFPLLIPSTGNHGFLDTINIKLFLSFLKIGAILYGSGYVLFAFLDAELVGKGILQRRQLIDAIAVGQFTPGPVFSSVTFIGYQINGIGGAIVSTIGVFLPSFMFVALLNPLVRKMRKSRLFAAFLNAVNVASVALIMMVCYQMAKDSISGWQTQLIAVCSMLILIKFRQINTVFIVLGGSLAGYLLLLI